MARKKVEERIPSMLDLWLACDMLNKTYHYISLQDLYVIIGGYVMNNRIDSRLILKLRKAWLKVITLGLTEEERNELVNK